MSIVGLRCVLNPYNEAIGRCRSRRLEKSFACTAGRVLSCLLMPPGMWHACRPADASPEAMWGKKYMIYASKRCGLGEGEVLVLVSPIGFFQQVKFTDSFLVFISDIS